MKVLPSFYFFAFLFFALLPSFSHSQNISSPKDFLGYELGESFTWHHQVISYFESVAEASPKVSLVPYGQSVEGRPLMVAVVSAEQNLAQIETLKKNNRIRTGLQSGKLSGKQLPIIWLSYNIHGNESVSTEAAMKTLYTLLTGSDQQWLEELIIVIDPCLNPDGRERYVNWYKHVRNLTPNVLSNSIEHHEPWPGGRYNHYLFDLNRDWCWQTQVESQQRAKLFRQWMPHVHVDFHEMGANASYYFGPAAKPYHEVVNEWQTEFQQLVGKNHARYFDQNGWLFFTKETYDLLYPSYGDTWPTFQGSVGFTYEQGGSGAAGLRLKLANGDTLSLADRIAHHFTTGISTIETAFVHRDQLLKEFNTYFQKAQNNPPGPFKGFVIKAENANSSVQHLLQLLDNNQIQYERVKESGKSYRGYDYETDAESSYTLQANDIVISAYQPQANLVKVLFEPNTYLEDSLTYDLTAWSLPYAYNLSAFASKEKMSFATDKSVSVPIIQPQASQAALSYLVEWNDVSDATFLAALHQKKIKARYSTNSFQLQGKSFDRGTLILSKADNPHPDFEKKLLSLAEEHQQTLIPTQSGFVDDGKDLGSRTVQLVSQPKIALINGPGVTPASFGEMWHYFEQVLDYPVTVIHSSYLSDVSIASYDLVILCSGNYDKFQSQLMLYLSQGGKIIALERSINTFTKSSKDKPATTLLGKALAEYKKAQKKKEEEKKKKEDPVLMLKKYENRERARLSNFVAGSIYRINMDASHPLSFGIGPTYYSIKRSNTVYPFLPNNGWNVGVINTSKPVSGFTGSTLREKLNKSLSIGVERVGKGQLIYLTDSPILRGFWHSGKLLLGNAIFLM